MLINEACETAVSRLKDCDSWVWDGKCNGFWESWALVMTKILMMNPNSNRATTAAMCEIAQRILGIAPVGWTAPEGPALLATPDLLDAAGGLVAAADIPEDTDAIILSAFGDPGFAQLADKVSCPVIGIGGAAARAASQKGVPFAVATTTPALTAPIDALMRQYAGDAHYVGCFSSEGDPNALMQDEKALDAALLSEIVRAEQAGAAHVIIGGGPLGEAAIRLEGVSPVPLFNPIACAAREVVAFLGGRL